MRSFKEILILAKQDPILFLLKVGRHLACLARLPLRKTPLVPHAVRKAPWGTHYCYASMSTSQAHDCIYHMLLSPAPCMVAKFGRVELVSLTRLHFMLEKKLFIHKATDFLCYRNNGFLFDTINHLDNMKTNAGFFPLTKQALVQFYHLCLQDMPECDLLMSWIAEEHVFQPYLTQATYIPFDVVSFLYSKGNNIERPWTAALKGKKVLVIHPFQKSIERQYARRDKLFPHNPAILPEFNLQTIKAVTTLGDEQPPYSDWFAALEHMKQQIEAKDFDIALLGCGAYGFNLAAHIKRMGKKAVHIGGALQYLFGISSAVLRGYSSERASIENDYWVRPLPEERPLGYKKIEGGCYW